MYQTGARTEKAQQVYPDPGQGEGRVGRGHGALYAWRAGGTEKVPLLGPPPQPQLQPSSQNGKTPSLIPETAPAPTTHTDTTLTTNPLPPHTHCLGTRCDA